MTEEEAKTKWCPYARLDGNNRHWGSGGDAAPISRCVASACMAWRWDKKPNPDWKPQSQMAMWPPRNPYAEDLGFIYDTEHGSCGLARSS